MTGDPQSTPPASVQVLVAATIVGDSDAFEGARLVRVDSPRGDYWVCLVSAADVRPVPPTPDYRNAVITALRGHLDWVDENPGDAGHGLVATDEIRSILRPLSAS